MKKRLLLIIGLMALFSVGLLIFKRSNNPSGIQPNLISASDARQQVLSGSSINSRAAQTYYNQWLNEHNHKIWSLLKHYKITKQNLTKLKQNHIEAYAEHIRSSQAKMGQGQPISEETYRLVNKVLRDFEIDPDSVRVLPYSDGSISPACANDRTLFINEELLNKYPYKAQLFVLGHELNHIINEDDSLGFIAFYEMPPFKQEVNHPLNQLHRIQELRADMGAIAKSADYAEGQQMFLQEFLDRNGEGRGISHPKLTTRLALGRSILQHYHTA